MRLALAARHPYRFHRCRIKNVWTHKSSRSVVLEVQAKHYNKYVAQKSLTTAADLAPPRTLALKPRTEDANSNTAARITRKMSSAAARVGLPASTSYNDPPRCHPRHTHSYRGLAWAISHAVSVIRTPSAQACLSLPSRICLLHAVHRSTAQ